MKPKYVIRLAVVVSIAVTSVIAFVAFGLLRDMEAELRRLDTLNEIADKTRALHILAATDTGGSDQADVRQIKTMLQSLKALLKEPVAQTAREEVLIQQLGKSYNELGPLIDQWFASKRAPGGMERQRQDIFASQIWVKVQFISDDTRRLKTISQSRIVAAQQQTGLTIIALIILLAATNAAIYLVSLRRLLRTQRALQESQRDLDRGQAVAHVGSWHLNVLSNELRWSDESYRIAGIPKGTPLTYESFLAIVHPDDREYVDRKWKAALQGEPYDIEHRIVVDGEVKWAREQAQLDFDTRGQLLGGFGAFQDITERKHAEQRLREALLEAQLLHRLTMDMARGGESQDFYERIMDAAVEIMHSDFASLQMLYPERGQPGGKGELRLLASRGFPPESVAHWEWVTAGTDCACGVALKTGTRCDVADLANDARIKGRERDVYFQAGIFAVQTTPLFARDGRLLGAISTHWKRPRDPGMLTERDWRMFEVLVQHAADLLERFHSAHVLRESEQRIREIIQQLPAGVGVMDASGKWVLSNPLMEQYVPLAIPSTLPDRVPRWRAWDEQGNAVPPENWPGQRALRGETVAPGLQMLYRTDEGQEVWMRVSAGPLRDEQGQIVGATAVVQNIDAITRAEQALRQSEEALREIDRRKNEFLATLAHELRNPLAPIRNAVQILHIRGPAVPELQWARGVIDRQIQQMTRLIDDLMDVSRINQGKIELKRERVALATVVQGAVETSRPLIDQFGHELTVNLPPQSVYLDADLTRLAQAFSNLLNNAAKYTERGGAISLTAERQGGDVVVSVKDSGIGIPGDSLRNIFELFSQVQGTSERSQGGLGIGLSLVKQLVEMHGGTIEARSEGRGKGSEFVVRLPIVVEEKDAPAYRGGERPVVLTLARRILIVDDNRDAADSLGMMLRMMGNEIHTAYDGEEAVSAAAKFKPQVALLDIGLPKLNGYEVCRRIRQQPWGEPMVLIALTGWGQEDDKRKAEDAGFDRHMVKPVDPSSLITLLGSLPRERAGRPNAAPGVAGMHFGSELRDAGATLP